MKTGNRKFYGFLITVCLYTAVLLVMVFKRPELVVDLSAFAVQSSLGYCGIAGLFFAANVTTHFANNSGKKNESDT